MASPTTGQRDFHGLIYLAENFPMPHSNNENLNKLYSLMKEMIEVMKWVDGALERVKAVDQKVIEDMNSLDQKVKEDMKSMDMYVSDSEVEDGGNLSSSTSKSKIDEVCEFKQEMLKMMIPSLFYKK